MIDLKDKKILVVSPHPDDEIIGCGGLMSLAKSRGAKVYVLYMCVGKSRQLVTGSTNEDIRLKETEDVAKFCGFEYNFVYVGKNFLMLDALPQKEIVDVIEDKIAEFLPDIVCIPSANSYDQDHRAVYTACITAMRPVPKDVRHFTPVVLEFEEPYVWSVGDVASKTNIYFELNDSDIDFKVKAMALHKTQDRQDPFPRSGNNLSRWAQIRGKEIGSFAAEAYRCHRMAIR